MNISTIFKFGVWGIESLIVGIKATYAKANTEIVDSLIENAGSWKKTSIPINPKIQSGIKMVKILLPGYL